VAQSLGTTTSAFERGRRCGHCARPIRRRGSACDQSAATAHHGGGSGDLQALGIGIRSDSNLTVENCTITENVGGSNSQDGGIYAFGDSEVTLDATSVTGSVAEFVGGGVFNTGGTVALAPGSNESGNVAPPGTANNCAPAGSAPGCVGLRVRRGSGLLTGRRGASMLTRPSAVGRSRLDGRRQAVRLPEGLRVQLRQGEDDQEGAHAVGDVERTLGGYRWPAVKSAARPACGISSVRRSPPRGVRPVQFPRGERSPSRIGRSGDRG
jgi:hypothetical protein